jgi:hypothetical protein
MIALALIPLFAFLNRLRGSGWVKGGKWIAYVGMTLAVASILAIDNMIGFDWFSGLKVALILASMAIAFAPGWGEYFPYRNTPMVAEFAPVDFLLELIYTDGDTGQRDENYILQRTVGMSLRWLICFAPLFGLLGYVAHSSLAIPAWASLVLAGPIYRAVAKAGKDNALSEWITGGLLGAACAICLIRVS